MVAGALAVVLLAGAATASLLFHEVEKIVGALGQNRAVHLAPHVLAPTSRGAPETLLLVGDDRRPPPKGNPNGFVVPHSNEMLLVRIDPSKPTISMLSIPRELQVTIFPHDAAPRTDRINVAYTLGGIQLMTETIKQVLGISVNHVFVITFPKFRRAVDEMGCVYSTIDRRYFHVNEPGGEQYFEINLQPGYQRLCGSQALQFVAYRHGDTSLVRDARDQRLLLNVKAQFGPSLFENREKFEHIFGKAVETDLHGEEQVLELLSLLVQAASKPVRQAHFQVNLLPTFDTATPEQIHESVQSFLQGTAPISRHKLNQDIHAAQRSHHHHGGGGPGPGPGPGSGSAGMNLVPTTAEELAEGRAQASHLPFPLEYPRVRDTLAEASPDEMRVYDIHGPGGHRYRSYVVVISKGELGQFYDVQGSTWTDPPLLAGPSQTIHLGRRTYDLYYEGENIKTVAWREGQAAYWIENTLTDSVPPREMLAIAAQTVPVGQPNVPPHPPSVPASLPPPPVRSATPSDTLTRVGVGLGILSVPALLALAAAVLLRRRRLGELRAQVHHALTLESLGRRGLAAAIAHGRVGPGAAAAAAGAAGAAGAPRPPAPADAAAPRHSRRVRWAAAGALAVAVLAVLAAARLRVFESGASTPPATHPAPPTLRVAVFNATNVPGQAHRVAGELARDRVHVAQIGNINASIGRGVYVLYPPGARAQAQHVSRLLAEMSPTVTPIQPQVQSAVGESHEIVVVLD